MDKRQIALRAAELIEKGKSEGVSARDASGEEVDWYNPSAVCFCMIGAVGAAVTEQLTDGTGDLANELVGDLNDFLARTGRYNNSGEDDGWVGGYSDTHDAATVAKALREWARELGQK